MKTNKLEKLFDRLRQEGWYCGWAHICCSSCAWMDVPDYHESGPFKEESVNFDKCLFNHEQDCCIEEDEFDSEEEEEAYYEMLDNYDGEGTMPTYTQNEIFDSCFCFSGDKAGVKNLKAILPIIEEMGCTYNWNGKGDTRISIDWSNDEI